MLSLGLSGTMWPPRGRYEVCNGPSPVLCPAAVRIRKALVALGNHGVSPSPLEKPHLLRYFEFPLGACCSRAGGRSSSGPRGQRFERARHRKAIAKRQRFCGTCPGGGIGRHRGLKIPRTITSLRVRVPPWVLAFSRFGNVFVGRNAVLRHRGPSSRWLTVTPPLSISAGELSGGVEN